MNTCKECKYAEWARTKAGALHPSGDGRCTFIWKVSHLPVAFYLISRPNLGGGWISRKKGREKDCPCFEKAK